MKTAYIIRHSKRDHIEDPKRHKEALLNKEGIEMARDFGRKLSLMFKKIKVYSSPVERCVQTGEYMQEAFSVKTLVCQSDRLGEPGPFVYADASLLFEQKGTAGVVEAVEKGEKLDAIRSEAEGTKILIDFVRGETEKTDEDTVLVFVTHDACVAPVIHFFTGEFICKENWIEFLGGLKIEFGENTIKITRQKGVI